MKTRAITRRPPMYVIACTLLPGLFAGYSIISASAAGPADAMAEPAAAVASDKTAMPVTPAAPIVVSDYLGREITLAKPAQRIVALAPHIVENLFSAGLGDRIIATVDYADYPDAARSIARIGGFSHFSREAILAYRPDLVIGWATGYQGFGDLLAQLQALGVPVYVDDPRHFSDIARSIVDFATLGGSEAPHSMLQSELHDRLAGLRETNGKKAALPVTVFYEIWHEPLQTLNGAHIVNEAIEVCGGRNVFADVAVLAPTISLEAVLQKNPEVIVASASSELRPATLDSWRRWPGLGAVANEQLYHVHGDLLSRHTLRMLDGVEALCGHIASARRARKDSRNEDTAEVLAGRSANIPGAIGSNIVDSGSIQNNRRDNSINGTSIHSNVHDKFHNDAVDKTSAHSNSETAALANRPGQATR
ncbi:MAG: cobalamin-binding protein [Pseudomonadales bacterium]